MQEMEGGAGLDQLRPAALKKLLAILKVRDAERTLQFVNYYYKFDTSFRTSLYLVGRHGPRERRAELLRTGPGAAAARRGRRGAPGNGARQPSTQEVGCCFFDLGSFFCQIFL